MQPILLLRSAGITDSRQHAAKDAYRVASSEQDRSWHSADIGCESNPRPFRSHPQMHPAPTFVKPLNVLGLSIVTVLRTGSGHLCVTDDFGNLIECEALGQVLAFAADSAH